MVRGVEIHGTFGEYTMLSDAKVRAAKPRPKSYKLSDANSLYLLVTPSGGKLWRYSYSGAIAIIMTASRRPSPSVPTPSCRCRMRA